MIFPHLPWGTVFLPWKSFPSHSLCFSTSLLEKHFYLFHILCSQLIYSLKQSNEPKSHLKFITFTFIRGSFFEKIFENKIQHLIPAFKQMQKCNYRALWILLDASLSVNAVSLVCLNRNFKQWLVNLSHVKDIILFLYLIIRYVSYCSWELKYFLGWVQFWNVPWVFSRTLSQPVLCLCTFLYLGAQMQESEVRYLTNWSQWLCVPYLKFSCS